MNNGLRDHMIKALGQGVRNDGRELLHFRDLEIETDVSGTAEGSARVKLGNTEIIVGVKLSIDRPFPDRGDEGIVMVGTELLPMSSPNFETGPPSIWAIEIARVTDRGIRESKAIDVKSLCIEKGEKVWAVSVDVCTLNDDGNLLDAASIGTLVALQNTRFPKVEEDGTINYKEKTDKPLPLNKLPVAVTLYKIGDKLVIDPVLEEEEFSDARLTVTSTADGSICALQKGGDEPFSQEQVEEMVNVALERAGELRKKIQQN